MCGDPLFHAGRYHNTILVKEGLGCNSEIEVYLVHTFIDTVVDGGQSLIYQLLV